MDQPRVAFVCTHNACRSQIAQAMAQNLAAGAFAAYSAGTHPVEAVNEDALRLLEREYGFDTTSLFPKTLADIPPVDILVTMGCGVQCPAMPARHREDWGLKDPTGEGDGAFLETMEEIRGRVMNLRARVLAGAFDRDRLATNLKTLGDPNRLRILELLEDGEERCACNLLESLEISQPTLSHHMAALREAGVVRARKEGHWMRYRLDREVLAAIGSQLGRIDLERTRPSI